MLILTCWLELVPSWGQVGSKLGQVGTKIRPNGVHKQTIHTFTCLPRSAEPVSIDQGSNGEATRMQQGSNEDGTGVDPGQIFGVFSERFR